LPHGRLFFIGQGAINGLEFIILVFTHLDTRFGKLRCAL
jgi:hypothetical protein